VWEGEFVGGYAILDPDGSSAGPLVRPIVWNSAGWWDDDANTTVCEFRLGDMDGTEDVSGEDVHLVHPGGVLIVPQASSDSLHQRYFRVRIAGGQDVPDSYYTIGSMVLGSVLIPGRQWSDGWSWTVRTNVEETVDSYGTRYLQERGPPRAELTVSWQDPQDWRSIRQDGSPDYIAAGGSTAPEAARNDVWMRLKGMMRAAASGELAVVALADIPSSTTTITDPTLWLYGTTTSDVQANQVVGDEGDGEVYRTESITIIEQPWDPCDG
jgi:hypothetical protein